MNKSVVHALVGVLCLGAVCAGAAEQSVQLRSRAYLMPQDFETKRPDGRYENHMAFAWDYVRRMVPEYSFDKVKDGAELPAWREINASVAWPEYTYRDQALAGAPAAQGVFRVKLQASQCKTKDEADSSVPR